MLHQARAMSTQATFTVLRQRESMKCELPQHYEVGSKLYLLPPYHSPPIAAYLGWSVSTEFERG